MLPLFFQVFLDDPFFVDFKFLISQKWTVMFRNRNFWLQIWIPWVDPVLSTSFSSALTLYNVHLTIHGCGTLVFTGDQNRVLHRWNKCKFIRKLGWAIVFSVEKNIFSQLNSKIQVIPHPCNRLSNSSFKVAPPLL